MSQRSAGNSGKWLAGGLVVIGLIAAVVAWKFRMVSPQPVQPTPPLPPPTTTLAEPP